MTLALTGWSNVWAEEGDPVDWYLYFYKDAVVNTDQGQFVKTGVDNIYRLQNVVITETYALGIYYCVHNDAWSTKWGYKDEETKGEVKATWSPVTLGTFAGNAWLQIHAGTYTVILDMTDASNPTIEFDPVLTIDEAATSAPSITADYYYTTLNRTLTADKWQTICLPVWLNMTGDNYLVSTYFGAGTEVAEFNSADGNVLNFTTVTTNMDYNTPYLIKPTTSITSVYLGKIWVSSFSPATVTKRDYNFIGTNHKMTLSSGEYYVANDRLHQQNNTNTTIKGTRAYFTTPALSARKMSFSIDGVVTSIDQIEIPEEKNVTGDIYNLNGQRMDKPFESLPAGVYIVNGKKIVKN